jgi:hypothetical protein
MWMLVDATAILLFLRELFATLRMLWLNFMSFEEVTLYWPETEMRLPFGGNTLRYRGGFAS